ncbi:hypothetical protein ACHAQA_001212 [Verticillium albo-atrum]
MTPEQLEAYATHFRIQEITAQLRLPDTALQARMGYRRCRDRSPDPEYDAAGRRTNTRVQRRRRVLEAERHRCIDQAIASIPSYRPPHDYRRPSGFIDRVYIPQAEFPSINFIGQILGPRGASLKAMQGRAGANIVIRGNGSVKEGRGKQRAKAGTSDDSSKPLHVLITADAQNKVEEGKKLIQQVIDNAVSTPEWQNEHKKQQLRELAIANGTFRDDEGRLASEGHLQVVSQPAVTSNGSNVDAYLDQEYDRLMEDIDGCPRDSPNGGQKFQASLPPWRADRLP